MPIFLCGVLLLAVTSCQSMGPRSMVRDRFSYSDALADSWKNQMLLNLVKTRYLDLPIYLEVGQIVSGYSLERTLEAGADFASMGGGNTLGVGASGTFTDRPTITYTPLTGERFLEAFLAPINSTKVLSLVQAGYDAAFILELSLDSLNGLRNRPVTLTARHTADPEFFRALTLLRDLQSAGVLEVRREGTTNGSPATVLFFREAAHPPEVQALIGELRGVLGLAAGETTFRVVPSVQRVDAGQVSMSTRSLSQIMTALSLNVEIPPEHEKRRLTPPMPPNPESEVRLLAIHSGSARPEDAFVAVPYEGYWFWIANDDWISKRTFSSILFLFTLADTGEAEKMPLITIPAQ